MKHVKREEHTIIRGLKLVSLPTNKLFARTLYSCTMSRCHGALVVLGESRCLSLSSMRRNDSFALLFFRFICVCLCMHNSLVSMLFDLKGLIQYNYSCSQLCPNTITLLFRIHSLSDIYDFQVRPAETEIGSAQRMSV